jgi:hypothetical protein
MPPDDPGPARASTWIEIARPPDDAPADGHLPEIDVLEFQFEPIAIWPAVHWTGRQPVLQMGCDFGEELRSLPPRSPEAERAAALFPEALYLRAMAAAIADAHPRAIDYVEQAPVLVAAALPSPVFLVAQDLAASDFARRIAGGPKLRDLMASYGLAYPLRRLLPSSVSLTGHGILKMLGVLVDASTLAQAMPAGELQQHRWLVWLSRWLRALDDRIPRTTRLALCRWGVAVRGRASAGDDYPFAGEDEIADFIAANPGRWNARWTWDRAARETRAWHDALMREQDDALIEGLSREEVDYSPFPDEQEVGRYRFAVLRSRHALALDGQAMGHCVGGYWPLVAAGLSQIYSIRDGDVRVATLEIARGAVRQVHGPRNSRVADDVTVAAAEFAARYGDAGRVQRC